MDCMGGAVSDVRGTLEGAVADGLTPQIIGMGLYTRRVELPDSIKAQIIRK